MIKLLLVLAGLTLAAPLPLTPAELIAARPATTAGAPEIANIPFDPPLDAALRYRWEKTVRKNDETRMSWAVSEFRFEPRDRGYRLTITPVSSGSNERDPDRLAMEKRLEKLLNFPFVLHLDESGSIEQLEEGERYWSTIVQAMRDEFDRIGGKSELPSYRETLKAVMGLYEKMPGQARLALLTESIQPALEFGGTETQIGKPIVTTIEGASPFGGKLKRNVAISLTKVVDRKAFLSIQSTLPRSELDALSAGMMASLVKLPAEKQAEMKRGMASLESFRHETGSDYQVSVDDGMLDKFLSTETIEVSDKGKKQVRITTRSLDRVN